MEKYCNNIMQAMRAIYEKMHILLNYSNIKLSVEYSIIQLYSYGINCCLKYRCSNNTSLILKYLSQLRHLKRNYISIDYKNNPYVQKKIPDLDQKLMQKNDIAPHILVENE